MMFLLFHQTDGKDLFSALNASSSTQRRRKRRRSFLSRDLISPVKSEPRYLDCRCEGGDGHGLFDCGRSDVGMFIESHDLPEH